MVLQVTCTMSLAHALLMTCRCQSGPHAPHHLLVKLNSCVCRNEAADAGVARLLLCTVCHCWKDIQPHVSFCQHPQCQHMHHCLPAGAKSAVDYPELEICQWNLCQSLPLWICCIYLLRDVTGLVLLAMVCGSSMLGLPVFMQDWSAMLKRVGSSVSQATVLLEELTEGIAAAAVEGASVVSRGRQGGDVGPSVAVELLWRLRHLGLSNTAEGTKVLRLRLGSLKTLCVSAFRSVLSVVHFSVL